MKKTFSTTKIDIKKQMIQKIKFKKKINHQHQILKKKFNKKLKINNRKINNLENIKNKLPKKK